MSAGQSRQTRCTHAKEVGKSLAPKRNWKKLNELQLRTLAILQGFAESDIAGPGETDGEICL